MRVLMFGWEFPPFQAGGLATATVGLVKGLLKNRIDVTLVVPFPAEGSPLPGLRLVSADAPAERLTVHRIPSPVTAYGGAQEYTEVFARVSTPRRPGRSVYGADLFEEVQRFASLAGDIAAREPHDLIDTHDWITFAAGIEARRRSGKPMVAHIHATEFDRSGDGADPRIARREWEGLSAADRIVSNSQVLKRQVVERYLIPTERIDVVHWGIDRPAAAEPVPPPVPAVERSPFLGKPPVVLFLGRVTRQKGPDYFIEVAGRVAQFVPETKFIVAGNGDLLPQVIRRSVELGLADRIHFAGGLHGAEVDRAFAIADVCVMPSVSEPFGLVALESLRNGTPCIVPKESGAAEVLRNAFKVDFWDIEEMTNMVVATLRYRPLREELSERGRQELTAQRFGLEEPARLTALAYRHAIEPRGGH